MAGRARDLARQVVVVTGAARDMWVGVVYLSWADTDMVLGVDENAALEEIRTRLPFPADRTSTATPAVDALRRRPS